MKLTTRVCVLSASAFMTVALSAPPAALADDPSGREPTQALTAPQQAWYDAKLAMAESYKAGDMAPMAPEPICLFNPCEPTSKTLATRARQQNNGWYCGPATGQVLINFSRGVVDSNLDGQRASSNWKLQSTIAGWMHTTSDNGTGGGNFAIALNRSDAILKPVPTWLYLFKATGTTSDLHAKVITDVYHYGMPLGIQTAPHLNNQPTYHLASFPNECDGCHHWIALRGYSGRLSDPSPRIYYNDSSAGVGGSTGAFSDLTTIVWKVNDLNNGSIVW